MNCRPLKKLITFFIFLSLSVFITGSILINQSENKNVAAAGNKIFSGNDEIYIYPSGQACGVKLVTDGVLVISSSKFKNFNGVNIPPAKNAGILPGDFITSFNGTDVKNTSHLMALIKENKEKTVTLGINRKGKAYTVSLSPISPDNINYFLGLWVRDSTAGLGTLTYFSADKSSFAALGHSVTDIDTNEIMPVGYGELIKSSVISVKKGSPGFPGELVGVFDTPELLYGNIIINNEVGIFGKLADSNILNGKPLKAARKDETEKGPAKIICTTDEKGPQEYDIEILEILSGSRDKLKNMIIEVTDKKLLERTGGIVQGMSGSPIIQGNKIIGAVTHVFVNNPKKGYGIFIENMLEETEKIK